MRRSGSSGPLRIHLIPSDPATRERIRTRVRERTDWQLTTGLSPRIPPDTDVVLIPADRCADDLEPSSADVGEAPGQRVSVAVAEGPDPGGPSYLAYGPAEHLAGCVLRGCVDFLKEPWDEDELEFRLERLAPPVTFTVAGTTLRIEPTRLSSDIGSTELSPGERAVLEALVRHRGEPVSREALFYGIWGTDGGDSRVIDVYVSRLRGRIREVLPRNRRPNPLRAVRGLGYTLDA
jgi:hypothetical protein